MNIPYQLLQIGVFLADNGFVSILKKMTVALVALVEIYHISGQ
jgi:hypothetical protein